jgi:hypothetical protein
MTPERFWKRSPTTWFRYSSKKPPKPFTGRTGPVALKRWFPDPPIHGKLDKTAESGDADRASSDGDPAPENSGHQPPH